MELNDESSDMNVFDKLIEGKHNKIVSNNDDDSMSIENTNNLFLFGQNNTPATPCLSKDISHTNTKKITKWKTLGGTFTTNYESLLDLKFPEISTSKVVMWQAHVDDKISSKEAVYDMIMGMDLMTYIGITVDCEQRCIRWGGTETLLKTRNKLSDNEVLQIFCKKHQRYNITFQMQTTVKLRYIPLCKN
jgi:hypothetical protein